MGDEFMCNVLTIVGILLVVVAATIVPPSIVDSAERFGEELHDYFEGEE